MNETDLVQKITDRPLYLWAPTTHPRLRIVVPGFGRETDAKLNLYAASNPLCAPRLNYRAMSGRDRRAPEQQCEGLK